MAIPIPGVQPLGYNLSGLGFAALSKTWVLQRQYHWQLFMPHIINGVLGPFVSQFCQDVRIGNYSIRQLSTIQYGAFQRFYAGLQGIQSAALTFIMPVDNSVMDYFHGWSHLTVDQNGYYFPKNNYKKQIYVAMYDRSGVESVRLVLKGAFPMNKPTIEASYEGDGLLRLGIVLSVDAVETTSLIGSIRTGITNVVGDVARKTVEMLGDAGGTVGGVVSAAGNIL